MDNIKVGEYVKTTTGKITRLIKIDKHNVTVGHGMQELQVYSKFENSHYIYANNYEELYEKINKYITKHSFNIKELILPSDILVFKIKDFKFISKGIVYREYDARKGEFYNIVNGHRLEEIQIIKILTHEQYERNCYTVKEEE